jgi:hypothetical protein
MNWHSHRKPTAPAEKGSAFLRNVQVIHVFICNPNVRNVEGPVLIEAGKLTDKQQMRSGKPVNNRISHDDLICMVSPEGAISCRARRLLVC